MKFEFEFELNKKQKSSCFHPGRQKNLIGKEHQTVQFDWPGITALGIMGAQLTASLKPLGAIRCVMYEGFQGAINGPPLCPETPPPRPAVREIGEEFAAAKAKVSRGPDALKCHLGTHFKEGGNRGGRGGSKKGIETEWE